MNNLCLLFVKIPLPPMEQSQASPPPPLKSFRITLTPILCGEGTQNLVSEFIKFFIVEMFRKKGKYQGVMSIEFKGGGKGVFTQHII